MDKEIIVLAKSIKSGDYCIAGIDKETCGWIRPVSDIDSGAVPADDLVYEDGEEVQVLDLVKIPKMKPVPTEMQGENWTYNSKYYWERISNISLCDVIKKYPEILYDGKDIFGSSEYWIEEKNVVDDVSLILVYLEYADVGVITFPNRKKVTLNFNYKGSSYKYLNITDPVFTAPYYNSNDGYYTVSDIYVLISLAPTHTDGKRYKVVAQIFE